MKLLPCPRRPPAARVIARMLTINRNHLSKMEAITAGMIERASRALLIARNLIDHFHSLIRTRNGDGLKPASIRVDNGPEYISSKLLAWAEKHHISIRHIQPGKPQQNAHIERYNRTVRHEWLDQYIIESIEEAQGYATEWLWTYNNERPNMGIGGITPPRN